MDKIKAKKLRRVNAETLIVTIDMGKTTPVGYCRCPDGTEVKPFEFANTRAGFIKLWNCIVQTKTAKSLKEVVVGYESTGCYAEPLLHFFKDKPVRLIQVNPLHTKRLKELNGNSPHKTDQKDPKVIADIIELGHGLTVVIPKGAAAELRRLTQARERELKRRTALYNQLQDLVFLCFPELLQLMKNVKTKTTQHLLQHYPTPALLLAQGVESLAFTLRRVSKGKLGLDRAKALYAAAENSVGISDGLIGLNLEIQALLAAITTSDTYITSLEHAMRHQLEAIPYSKLLLSMKGLGVVTVAGLIGEVGDFTKFHTQSEMLKLAGLDLFEISSGKHKGQKRISKRGRSLMRKLLFFAAINTVRKGGIMHGQYHQYLQNGMKKMKALIAIARKLLGIMFALVRTQKEYDVNYQKVTIVTEPQLLLAA
jgi:transposase